MNKVADNLWVGSAEDEKWIIRHDPSMTGVLVVAHDMVPCNDWKDRLEYMHVGIIDGPGNPLAVYHAAVLALVALVRRGADRRVLVCDHNGGRAMAVAIMYLYLMGEGPSWDEFIERKGGHPHSVHKAHRDAFFKMDWGMMRRVLEA